MTSGPSQDTSGDRRAGAAAPDAPIALRPVGWVTSPLLHLPDAPRQPDEGAPGAWIEFVPAVRDALDGIRAGDSLVLLTWLDRARRDVLHVHPRDDAARPLTGVFATRSADRPNPIGLHLVEVVAVDGLRIRVRALEATNGTPILDVKSVLPAEIVRR